MDHGTTERVVQVTRTSIKNVLTRTSGYLQTVTTHSLQPYRGCTFGNSLCGVGCYVRHNQHVLKGREWGSFLEIRTNAAKSYLENVEREARWAARRNRPFSIFCSSSTDPFVPQEFREGVTRSVLTAMLDVPPDALILQTHSHRVAEYLDLLRELDAYCRLRIHVTIETDYERLPGLPPHSGSIEKRFEACAVLRQAGLEVAVTVAPLLPIEDPQQFFSRIAEVADAVVLDHYIQGDGSADGARTLRTPLPQAIEAVCPESVTLEYRDRMEQIARQCMPGRVGVNIDGFAGRYS